MVQKVQIIAATFPLKGKCPDLKVFLAAKTQRAIFETVRFSLRTKAASDSQSLGLPVPRS
jgi:hypothetical protein